MARKGGGRCCARYSKLFDRRRVAGKVGDSFIASWRRTC